MHQEDRTRADLADLGPGAVGFAAALDASVARALTKARADAATGSLAGQLAGIGPLRAGARVQHLDGLRDADHRCWTTSSGIPRSGTVEMDPETVEVEGNTGTISDHDDGQCGRVSGSKLSVDLTMKIEGPGRGQGDRARSSTASTASCRATSTSTSARTRAGGTTANVKLNSSEVYGSGGGSKGRLEGVLRQRRDHRRRRRQHPQGRGRRAGIRGREGGRPGRRRRGRVDRHDADRQRQHRERRERPAAVRRASGHRARRRGHDRRRSRPGSSGRCPCSSRRW